MVEEEINLGNSVVSITCAGYVHIKFNNASLEAVRLTGKSIA